VGRMVAEVAPVEAISRTHDYFVVEVVPIEDSKGTPTGEMAQRQAVWLIEQVGERARIARDGVELGYVPLSALVPPTTRRLLFLRPFTTSLWQAYRFPTRDAGTGFPPPARRQQQNH
jgi:hypothetical protein